MPNAGKARAMREDDPPDLSTIPEADKTKENRGAVGIKQNKGGSHDSSGSLTTNAASGTIGGDTPPPIFDRAAIAAGQKGALATERVVDRTGPVSVMPNARANLDGGLRTTGTGPNAAVDLRSRGTPRPGVHADKSPLRVDSMPSLPPASPSRPARPDLPPSRPPARVPVTDDDSFSGMFPDEPPPSGSALAVPVGEFDHGDAILEQDKLRVAYTQATVQRDAASALLGMAEPARTAAGPALVEVRSEQTAARDDATFDNSFNNSFNNEFNDSSGSSTGQFERGDPTLGDERGDATTLSPPTPGHAPAGTLRSSAALPRKRGIAGDVRYVATVVFGVRAANRELAALEAQQATRQQSRRHHLVTLGRTAVTFPEWLDADPKRKDRSLAGTRESAEHPALGPAREQLASVENERSQHAGHVAAADSELTRVRRDREAKAKQYIGDVAALDTELLAIAKKLEPLDKEASGIKRRAADLHDALRRIDGKIASTEEGLTSAKGGKLDRAAIHAELATLRADRKVIQSDEPVIAGQLDALNPRIAALEAARNEAQRKRAELERAEQEDRRRVEELLTAIGAKRKVVDRAMADAEALRDKILFQLGERLYVDRPGDLTGQLAPIDEIDVELGIADRRIMELREITSSIDKLKIARGIALIALVLGAIGALIVWRVFSRS